MIFGGFKETNESEETNENKESSVDNVNKHRNQILETLDDDYNDDFATKLDSDEKDDKKDFSGNKDGGEDKQGWFSHIRNFFKKDKLEDSESEDAKETTKEPVKSQREIFVDSIKAKQDYSNPIPKRPEGGEERERERVRDDFR